MPVGEDQRQHLEFARECATNFNHTFGAGSQLLVPPETILCTSLPIPPAPAKFPGRDNSQAKCTNRATTNKKKAPAKRIMSLQNPSQKMSKSDADARSRILLTDSPAEIRAKVMAARTDSTNAVSYHRGARPGVSNLLDLWACFDSRGRAPEALAEELRGASLGDLKVAVADVLVEEIPGIGERYRAFLGRDGGRYLDEVEERGAGAARRSAEGTMEVLRRAVGLSR